jgi:hypothetical protein
LGAERRQTRRRPKMRPRSSRSLPRHHRDLNAGRGRDDPDPLPDRPVQFGETGERDAAESWLVE